MLAFLTNIFDTPVFNEDIYFFSEVYYGKTDYLYYLKKMATFVFGKYLHTPSLIFLQTIFATLDFSLFTYKAIHFSLHLLAIALLQYNLIITKKLKVIDSFLLILGLVSLPIISYSLFKLEAFTIGYFLGIAFLVKHKTISPMKLGLLLMLSTFISEVAFVFPIAFAIVDFLKEKNITRFLQITIPSVLIILAWFGLEYYFATEPFSLMIRNQSATEPSFSNSVRVMGNYISRFTSDFSLQIIVILTSLVAIFRKDLFRFRRFTSPLMLSLILSAIGIATFFFFYSHYHSKDLIGVVTIVFFILLTQLLSSENHFARASVAIVISINIILWFYHSSSYFSPLLILHSRESRPMVMKTLREKYSLEAKDVSLSKTILSYLGRGSPPIPLAVKRKLPHYLAVLSPNRYALALEKNWCPLHTFTFKDYLLISDGPVFNCTLEQIHTNFLELNNNNLKIYVLYKK